MLGNLQQIKSMMAMLNSSGDPMTMINQMARNNPQLQNVLQMVQANGGDPKAAFYKLAEEKGVDPDEIINALKG